MKMSSARQTLFKLVVGGFLLTIASAIKYSDCGSTSGSVKEVLVSGCEDSDVCELPKGSTARIDIVFESMEKTDSLRSVVHGVIGGIPWPFVLKNPDACVDCGLECPLESGNNNKFYAIMEISRSYPEVYVDVKWELMDDKKRNMVCVLIPSRIVKA